MLWTIFVFILALVAEAAQKWDESIYTSSPPVYPSPKITGAGSWKEALSQAKSFVTNITLSEKTGLVTGKLGPCVGNIGPIKRLGFRGLCLQDGPVGIRQAIYASVFPSGITTAASWDRDLMRLRGQYMGEEFKGKGANLGLGPVSGPLGRSPFGGRNWEGFSPDPYLSAAGMEETIQGMQSTGLQACAKHYIGNEQETHRNPGVGNSETSEAVSSNIDDRTMHELYLWPFASAVHAGVASIMCSYNRLNGSYGCQNSKTLNGLLKEELGFQGYVVSDWGATHSGVSCVKAGLDMDMPGGIGFLGNTPTFFGANLTTAVRNGSIPESRLDDMATRVMTPYFYLGQDKNEYPTVDPSEQTLNTFLTDPILNAALEGPPSLRDVRDNHASLIRQLGSAGIVLLKNKNNALPLHKPKTMGIFGNDAGDLTEGQYFAITQEPYGWEFGTLPVGGGSGSGHFSSLVSPLEAIKARAGQDSTLLQYFLDNTKIQTAFVRAASAPIAPIPPEVCLVFLKTWAAEGKDRTTLLADWNSTTVVNTVASFCPNTVVVTHSGGINTMPWASNKNVTAILAAHYPGEEIGNSITDVLYGDYNPSGKLPYTIALNEEDYNTPITNSSELQKSTDPNAWQSNFKEGLMIDYRYFDVGNKPVLFEFGYGLSYTNFSISNVVHASTSSESFPASPPAAPTASGGNPNLFIPLGLVTATITNTGSVLGAAVPQLYLSLGNGAPEGTPTRQLRGFQKLLLQPGESKPVTFALTRKDLSYWDTGLQDWVIPAGEMTAHVGFSSRDIKGKIVFSLL